MTTPCHARSTRLENVLPSLCSETHPEGCCGCGPLDPWSWGNLLRGSQARRCELDRRPPGTPPGSCGVRSLHRALDACAGTVLASGSGHLPDPVRRPPRAAALRPVLHEVGVGGRRYGGMGRSGPLGDLRHGVRLLCLADRRLPYRGQPGPRLPVPDLPHGGRFGHRLFRGDARACYEPTPRMPVACWRKRQAKATKCNPANVAGSLS